MLEFMLGLFVGLSIGALMLSAAFFITISNIKKLNTEV
jgi:hypothetical protein